MTCSLLTNFSQDSTIVWFLIGPGLARRFRNSCSSLRSIDLGPVIMQLSPNPGVDPTYTMHLQNTSYLSPCVCNNNNNMPIWLFSLKHRGLEIKLAGVLNNSLINVGLVQILYIGYGINRIRWVMSTNEHSQYTHLTVVVRHVSLMLSYTGTVFFMYSMLY